MLTKRHQPAQQMESLALLVQKLSVIRPDQFTVKINLNLWPQYSSSYSSSFT